MMNELIIGIILSIDNERDLVFAKTLYDNYYILIRSTIVKIIKRKDSEIADLVHDTYVQLIDKIQLLYEFKDKTYLLNSYICVVAKNTALNFIKRNNIKSKLLFYGEEDDIMDSISDKNDEMPENLLIIKENSEKLNKVIKQLPDKYRLILQYKYFMEMDDKDIARIFDINSESVRVYVSRARKMAYKLLAGGKMDYE